jgi:predicted RNase H-like HicB family nuclease
MGSSRTYSVVLTAEPEAGGFSVSVPALPGCYSQGETLDEALANVREAIELYLEIMVEAGETPPDDATRVEQVTVAV